MGNGISFLLHPNQRPKLTFAVIVALSLLAGVLICVIDAVLESIVFTDKEFVDSLLFNVSSHELFMRMIIVISMGVLGIFTGIYHLKQMELRRRVDFLNGLIGASRSLNQLIARETNINRLLDQACEILIKDSGIHNAWVALLKDGKPVEPFHHKGFEGSFSAMAERLKAGKQPACAKEALERGLSIVKSDPPVDCVDCACAHTYSGRSGICVRIEHHGRVYGWLTASMEPRYASDADLCGLFAEIGADLGHALRSIEIENERNQSELDLIKSEYHYRTLANSIPALIWRSRADKQCDYFNESWLNFTGRTLEQELGDGWAQGVHPDDYEYCLRTYTRAFDERKPFSMEYRLRHRDGSYRWLRDDARPYYSLDGAFLGYLGACIDIDEIKQAERNLRDSEKRFRTILDTLPQFVSYCDKHLVYQFVNQTYLNEFGLKQEDIIGKPVVEIIGRESLEKARPNIERVLSGETVRFHERFDYQHGPSRDMDGVLLPKFGQRGEVEGYYAILTDISIYMETQQALKQSEEVYRLLVDSANDSIFFHGLDGCFFEVNQVACERLGYSRDELLRMTLDDIDSPEMAALVPERVRQIMENGSLVFESVHVRKDGSTFPVEISTRLIDYKGQRAILSYGRDITDRKAAEEALREASIRQDEAVKAANVGLWDWNLLTDKVIYSREWKRQIGYEEHEIGDDLKEWGVRVHPDDYNQVIERVEHCKQTPGERYQSEFRLRHKDGSWRWIFSQGLVFRDASGEPVRMLGSHIDITDRKAAEEALREASIRQDEAVKAAHIGFWDWDILTDEVIFSPEWKKQIGYEDHEIENHLSEWEKRVHPDDLAPTKEKVQQSIETGEARHQVEFRLRHKDGSYRWILAQASVFADDNGQPVRMLGSHIDITERKAAEDALLVSQQRYRQMFDTNKAVKLIINPNDGRIVEANQAASKFYGYSQDQLKSMRIMDINTLSEDEIRAEMHRAELEERLFFQFRHRLASGEIRDVNVFSGPIRLGDETLLYSIVFDVTEQQRAEAERRRLMSAIEQTVESVIITDFEGTILYVNGAFEEITGYSKEEAIGQNPRLLKSGLQDEPYYKQLWDTISRGETWSGRLVNKKKDGTLFTEEAVISPVRGYGGVIENYVAVKRDITNEIALEEQLRQSQKMESVGRLAGGVAHDFNNMLSVILGQADLAKETIEPSNPLYETLDEIAKAAQRSADLTRQLLAFARKQNARPRVLDLNETIDGMLQMLVRLIGEHIELAWSPGENLWPVRFDPSQIDQIMANICVNARDAISDNGRIAITTSNRQVDNALQQTKAGLKPGDYVLLEITDTGAGMDVNTLENIFEPFFTTKETGQGTGLGLSMVYGIVKQNDGYIDVASAPDEGSAFSIYFKRHVVEDDDVVTEAAVSTISSSNPGGNETVLLVEDEELILELARKQLEGLGYHVITASRPNEALDAAKACEGRIDLLITDVIMPDMNGHELAKILADRCPDIKTLFISGYTADLIADHGVLDDNVEFLAKPFRIDELALKVRSVLDRSSSKAS